MCGGTKPLPPNDFHTDDAWQRGKRDKYLVPLFYKKQVAGRYVLMDKGRLSKTLQRSMAIDTVIQSKDGSVVSIEEKIVRWPATNKAQERYFLETESCTVPGHESAGWMQYGESDYLLYCFEQADGWLRCHLIEFQPLREWFGPLQENWREHTMPENNETRGRLVPFCEVRKNVSVVRFDLRLEA
jgi:hypothetical protein